MLLRHRASSRRALSSRSSATPTDGLGAQDARRGRRDRPARMRGEPAERVRRAGARGAGGRRADRRPRTAACFTIAAIVVLALGEHATRRSTRCERARAPPRTAAARSSRRRRAQPLVRRSRSRGAASSEARQEMLEAARRRRLASSSWGYGSLRRACTCGRSWRDAARAERETSRGTPRRSSAAAGRPTVAADGSSLLAPQPARARGRRGPLRGGASRPPSEIARDHAPSVNVAFNPWRGARRRGARPAREPRAGELALAPGGRARARAGARPASSAARSGCSGRSSATPASNAARGGRAARRARRRGWSTRRRSLALGSALRRGRKPTRGARPAAPGARARRRVRRGGLAEDIRSELYATGARPRSSALSGVGVADRRASSASSRSRPRARRTATSPRRSSSRRRPSRCT